MVTSFGVLNARVGFSGTGGLGRILTLRHRLLNQAGLVAGRGRLPALEWPGTGTAAHQQAEHQPHAQEPREVSQRRRAPTAGVLSLASRVLSRGAKSTFDVTCGLWTVGCGLKTLALRLKTLAAGFWPADCGPWTLDSAPGPAISAFGLRTSAFGL